MLVNEVLYKTNTYDVLLDSVTIKVLIKDYFND